MAKKRNALIELATQGQSIWLDNITRDLVQRGRLQALIDQGLRGITSNPTIFQKAIQGGSDYDAQIAELAGQGKTPAEILDGLMIFDIQAACDRFRPVFDQTNGRDGFVSIEVAPRLAYDTAGSIAEAHRLWQAVNRPNLFVKIPGTEEGSIAVKALLSEGLNINITLLFSLRNHERVMESYLKGLELRLSTGQPIDHVASVASFFVSRVDTLIDNLLDKKIATAGTEVDQRFLRGLVGKAGIANAKLAYARFREIFDSDRFIQLQLRGAKVQRPLWASTSTKNPAYRDVMYVESLIGPDTVNTVPDNTLDALQDHAAIARTIDTHLDQASRVIDDLKSVGIDYDAVTRQLETEGIQKFTESYDAVVDSIRSKLAQAR